MNLMKNLTRYDITAYYDRSLFTEVVNAVKDTLREKFFIF